MNPTLSLTMDGLVRALARLAERPAVDRAVADKAAAIAGAADAAGLAGVTTRVERLGPGDYAVTVSGPDGPGRSDIIARATGSLP